MEGYKVTTCVSRVGFALGLFFIILATLGGVAEGGARTGIPVLLGASVLTVPFLMFCEGMHALVTIANNTAALKAASNLKDVSANKTYKSHY